MKDTFNFWRWNRWTGFFVALFSFIVYLSTLEPTVSFWDCGEFLSCSNRLEVCHSPGAPLFLLTGRIAAMLAGSDVKHIAVFINGVSALASGLTIAFLFWAITWFGRKLLVKTWGNSLRQKIYILFAGVVGSLAFAFSDSFWFSAVEAEVYAMSAMFTAAVFWCILQWEECPTDGFASSRWLLLIAFLTGLSIGVHLLNLLTIPAVIMVYVFKNYPVSLKNALLALLLGGAILASVLFLLIPGIPLVFSWFEMLTVNKFHLPFNSGYICGLLFLSLISAFGLIFFRKRKMVLAYNAFVLLLLVVAGYSVYGVVVIRAHDNPPINMTAPESPFALQNYLNREQYEQRPLLVGPSFNSQLVDSKERFSYQRYQDKYIPYPLNPEYEYDPQSLILFPRMYSNNAEHTEIYKQWSGYKGKTSAFRDNEMQDKSLSANPTFGENMQFFVRYQLGFMYFRYFMWNFSGRQNDIQGHGNNIYGNWITGLPFIDRYLVGPENALPESLRNNPGRNTYFMLPLLLGLAGMFFQYKTNKQNFGIISMLFFFTGIAIVIYLNEIPSTPRERDYVYVGSFYVFSMWIGLGAIAVLQYCDRFKIKKLLSIVAFIIAFAVPVIMLWQNYDDHNRSHRYVVREYARNYLESCAPNAILFTNADNDTYPLWYAQEVEGIRKDVRIVLAPYLGADWYASQMRKSQGKNKGLKMTLGDDKFIQGKRAYLPVNERVDSSVELSQFLTFVGSEDDRAKLKMTNGESMNFVPSRKIHLLVDKQVLPTYAYLNLAKEDSLTIVVKGNAMRMDQLVLLDILASNHWERPVYFASAQVPLELGLQNYLQLDGYTYRLVPCKSEPKGNKDIGIIHSCSLYHQYMHDFEWTSLSDPRVYLDWTHITTQRVISLREKFARLAEVLVTEKKNSEAVEVLDKMMKILPLERIGTDYDLLRMVEVYLKAGERSKGDKLLKEIVAMAKRNCIYYNSLPQNLWGGIDYEIRLSAFILQESMRIAETYQLDKTLAETTSFWKEEENQLRKMLQQ